MKWLIEGAKKAIDNNFKIRNPKVVQDAIDKYKQDNDWMTHFLDDCCELGEEYETGSGKFYSAYRAYCQRVGDFTRSTTEFYNAIERYGLRRYKKKKTFWILGVKLNDTDFID